MQMVASPRADAGLLPQALVQRSARTYRNLDALRGVAALLVVFYHLQNIFSTKAGIVPFGGIFGAGNRGVDLFFVLSGFVIMAAHAGDIGRVERVSRYLYRRACRIFPSVWILTAAALVLYSMHFDQGHKGFKLDAANVLASALLLPQRGSPLVNVTWTLTYEVLFYAVFALLIARRRLGLTLFATWQACVALIALGVLPFEPSPSSIWLRPLCLEFGIGMVCALAVRSRLSLRRPALSWCTVALGAAIFIVGMSVESGQRAIGLDAYRVLVYGGSSGLLIVGLTRLERDLGWRFPSPFVRLGEASYAIYLVHFSFLTLAALALLHWRFPITNASMLACVALAVAAGGAFHVFVDRPIQDRLRDFGRRFGRSAALTSPASA